MKVIASSVRKGNVLDIDGKLCVVLTAESFHPGKGTPTTQIDMRRISDGVKISQRYKTVEQVERAVVEAIVAFEPRLRQPRAYIEAEPDAPWLLRLRIIGTLDAGTGTGPAPVAFVAQLVDGQPVGVVDERIA